MYQPNNNSNYRTMLKASGDYFHQNLTYQFLDMVLDFMIWNIKQGRQEEFDACSSVEH